MKKLAIVVLVCLICLTVIRYSAGNEKPITESALDVEFDDLGEIMKQLRANITFISIASSKGEERLQELIESFQGKGGLWLIDFANKLPGIFSKTKEALYIISASSWVNGNDTWATVQGYVAYISENVKAISQSAKLGGALIFASAGKLIELVQQLIIS